MAAIRVLVIDDSVVVRRLITDALDSAPDIEVVGTAANGEIGLERLESLKPDVVTLDIEMPVLDGIGTLRGIRRRHPRLPVIMFSTLTEAGASATLDALAAGASDFVTKPANVGSVGKAIEAVKQELVPRIRSLTGRSPRTGAVSTRPDTPGLGSPGLGAPGLGAPGLGSPGLGSPGLGSPGLGSPGLGSRPIAGPGAIPTSGFTPTRDPGLPAGPAPVQRPVGALPPSQGVFPPPRPTAAGSRRVTAVVIGVSTGGPNALADIWPSLGRLAVPILIVQHMPPVFTDILAKRLDALGTIPVAEAREGDDLVPGRAWIAPGGFHMTLGRAGAGVRIHLDEGELVNGCRPAVDPLFDSAAALYGAGTLAVVLTGMGSDGAVGSRAIRLAGGTVVAQDEESSVVWGMPGAVVGAGLADEVVPLAQVADTINRRVGVTRLGAAVPRP